MLQQTRVATVIPYFTAWLSHWPTVHDLAAASHADVLAAWKGLGYYSRATRLWEGAKAVVSSSSTSSAACKIPADVAALQDIPGIGRYTAGAISSIAFGKAEPVLDGNVARVLSRQLGLCVDVKEKKAADGLWEVAGGLVRYVAGGDDGGRSEVPGLWNQALMELGSTVCTPRPRCGVCPIRGTCRVYAEGAMLVGKEAGGEGVEDQEGTCAVCEVLDIEDVGALAAEDDGDGGGKGKPPAKRRKVEKKAATQANTISRYFTRAGKMEPAVEIEVEAEKEEEQDDDDDTQEAPLPPPLSTSVPPPALPPAHLKAITTYASLFPKRAPKKTVPTQDAVVCVVETRLASGRSEWLIEQRPATGTFPPSLSPPSLYPLRCRLHANPAKRPTRLPLAIPPARPPLAIVDPRGAQTRCADVPR